MKMNGKPGRARTKLRTRILAMLLAMTAGASSAALADIETLPAIFAVHEEFLRKATPEVVDRFLAGLQTEGLYEPKNAPDQIRLTSCRSDSPAKLIVFSNRDIGNYAQSMPQADLGGDASAQKGLLELKEPGSTAAAWMLLASSPLALNVVKAYALHQSGLAPNATFKTLRQVSNPLVIVGLPTRWIYVPQDLTDPNTEIVWPPIASIAGRAYRGSENYVVALTYRSLKSLNTEEPEFKLTFAHEVGHYLYLPHIFASAKDLSKEPANAQIRAAAIAIRDEDDCGKDPQMGADGSIRDVDFLQSKKLVSESLAISDTIPIWVGDPAEAADRCLASYDAQLTTLLHPKFDVMHYEEGHFPRQSGQLTKKQMAIALKRVAQLKTPGPANVCP